MRRRLRSAARRRWTSSSLDAHSPAETIQEACRLTFPGHWGSRRTTPMKTQEACLFSGQWTPCTRCPLPDLCTDHGSDRATGGHPESRYVRQAEGNRSSDAGDNRNSRQSDRAHLLGRAGKQQTRGQAGEGRRRLTRVLDREAAGIQQRGPGLLERRLSEYHRQWRTGRI